MSLSGLFQSQATMLMPRLTRPRHETADRTGYDVVPALPSRLISWLSKASVVDSNFK